MFYETEIETIASADVVIAGGGPSGIAAAIEARRGGKTALIIERAGVVGGCLTVGHVSPVSGRLAKNSMAEELSNLLSVSRAGVGIFEQSKIKLTELLAENGVDVFLNSSICDAVRDGDRIKSVIISTQNGLKAVDGKMFVDATGDGVLSYVAGEQIEFGRDDGLVQPMSVMFTISGADKNQKIMCNHEEHDTKLKKGNFLALCREACANGKLPPEINIVRLYDTPDESERVVNATQANGFDPLDPSDYNAAQVKLRSQMLSVMDFLRENVEGFENVTIKDSSDIVGVRESRRVMGEYVLTAEDCVAGRRFDDVIVHRASFPIDIHNPAGPGQAETDTLPHGVKPYDIPYRCIVPRVNDNLFTAGRCISGTHRAHASYRVMNHAINLGQAAGIAASLCIDEDTANRKLDYKKIQAVLASRGIDLFD